MALRRFYYENARSDIVTIDGELFHHIRDVCRFGVGDKFELLPGDGTARLVEIVTTEKRSFTAKTLSSRTLPPPDRPAVILALSVPKLPKVDWILEKSVELGVAEVRPFVSDYSFLRKPAELSKERLSRWEKIIAGATAQCGRGDLMRVRPAVTLTELFQEFNRNPRAKGLFPYEGEAQIGLPEAVRELKTLAPDEIWLFVGSEGGFSPREVELIRSQGLKPTSMGAQILRVETACVALVSVIKYEAGALS